MLFLTTCKGSANQAKYKTKHKVFVFISEVQPLRGHTFAPSGQRNLDGVKLQSDTSLDGKISDVYLLVGRMCPLIFSHQAERMLLDGNVNTFPDMVFSTDARLGVDFGAATNYVAFVRFISTKVAASSVGMASRTISRVLSRVLCRPARSNHSPAGSITRTAS